MTKRIFLTMLMLMMLYPLAAQAARPDETLADPVLEMRAREIGKELRCLVCQNESIDDSDASLAHDLRVVLRQRLLVGDTDEAARDYIVARYGDYVLLKPPLKKSTLALWLGPLLLFLAAMGGASMFYRQRMEETLPFDEGERRRLLALMEEENREPDA